MNETERTVIAVLLGFGVILIVGFVLAGIQGACLDYWATVGGESPPCWLPFGG